MATIKQLTTLMNLKAEAGEEFDKTAFVSEWMDKPHKLIQAEFKKLNVNRPATDSQLAWIAMLEQKVYGQVYSLGLNLSYQDACDRIPVLKLMAKRKLKLAEHRESEIEVLELRLKALKSAQASMVLDPKTGELVEWWEA
jgi:hypothetical protein